MARSKKEKHSLFLLTINPNKSFHKDQSDLNKYKQILTQCVNHIVSDMENFVKFKEEGGKYTLNFIKNIDVSSALEIGDSTKRLHSHSRILINHYTKIQLDRQKIYNYIQEQFNREFGEDHPKIYINITWIRDTTSILDNYISKHSQQI